MSKFRNTPAALLILLLLWPAPCVKATTHWHEVRLFTVEKSKNPQNILVVYTLADPQCDVQPVASGSTGHLFDVYWLMDGTTFKPTHPLIKKHIRKRFVALRQSDHQKGFKVRLSDLKELVHDLPSDEITITLHKSPGGGCVSRVLLPLGPNSDYRTLEIQSIYSRARTLLGIPIGVHYIELRGQDADSKEPLTVRFSSKRDIEEQRP